MNLSLSTKLEVKENPERSQQQSEQTGQRWVELDSGLMEESSRQPEPTPQVSGLKGGSRKRPVADEAESSEVFPLDRQRLCEGEPKLETEADIEHLLKRVNDLQSRLTKALTQGTKLEGTVTFLQVKNGEYLGAAAASQDCVKQLTRQRNTLIRGHKRELEILRAQYQAKIEATVAAKWANDGVDQGAGAAKTIDPLTSSQDASTSLRLTETLSEKALIMTMGYTF